MTPPSSSAGSAAAKGRRRRRSSTSGGASRIVVGRTAFTRKPASRAAISNARATGSDELERAPEADAAVRREQRVVDGVEARPTSGRRARARARAGPSRSIVVEHRERGGARDRVAAERRAVVAGHEHVARRRPVASTAPIGQPAAEALRERDDVGHARPAATLRASCPARPMPDCTSSTTRSAPARRRSRGRRRGSPAGGTTTPPSPWTGSRMTAAVRSVDGGAQRLDVAVRARTSTGPGSGSNGARLAGVPVTDSAPSVRPWNPPSVRHDLAARGPACCLRTILSAASLAVAPSWQRNTRARAGQQRGEPFRERDAGLVHREVAGVRERGRPAASRRRRRPGARGRATRRRCRRGGRGSAVPSTSHTHAPAPRDERDRRRAVVAHHHGVPARLQRRGRRCRSCVAS